MLEQLLMANRKFKLKKIKGVIIFIIGILLLMLLFFLPFYYSSLAEVREIRLVGGPNYIDSVKLRIYLENCGLNLRKIWDKPADYVQACIKEKSPLIKDVKFAYWNGNLEVLINEPKIVLKVVRGDDVYYVSDDGELYKDEVFDVLPSGVSEVRVPIEKELTKDVVNGLYKVLYSKSCHKLFNDKGKPDYIDIAGEHVKLVYNLNSEKVIIVPLYDLSVCEKVSEYWNIVWQENGTYVDFTHRNIIVVGDG